MAQWLSGSYGTITGPCVSWGHYRCLRAGREREISYKYSSSSYLPCVGRGSIEVTVSWDHWRRKPHWTTIASGAVVPTSAEGAYFHDL